MLLIPTKIKIYSIEIALFSISLNRFPACGWPGQILLELKNNRKKSFT